MQSLRVLAGRAARVARVAPRRQRLMSTTVAKPSDSEGMSTGAKIGLGLVGLAVPSYFGIQRIKTDPFLRQRLQVDYPAAMDIVAAVVPGGIETVTMEEVKAAETDWPEEWDAPWGEGYDEDIGTQSAVVTTLRGSQFLVKVEPLDREKDILQRAIALGASGDDKIINVVFVDEAATQKSQGQGGTSSSGISAAAVSAVASQSQSAAATPASSSAAAAAETPMGPAEKEARAMGFDQPPAQYTARLAELRYKEMGLRQELAVWENMSGTKGQARAIDFRAQIADVEAAKAFVKRVRRSLR